MVFYVPSLTLARELEKNWSVSDAPCSDGSGYTSNAVDEDGVSTRDHCRSSTETLGFRRHSLAGGMLSLRPTRASSFSRLRLAAFVSTKPSHAAASLCRSFTFHHGNPDEQEAQGQLIRISRYFVVLGDFASILRN